MSLDEPQGHFECDMTGNNIANLLLACRPDGFLYDKEAILEYIIHQKRDIARKLKEFEKQKGKLQV